MRNVFSSELVRAARHDARILLLTGDHGYALFDELRRQCPSQFINAGVAEQNMVGMAAGLAKAGLRPIVYGLSAFVPIRVYEQIKLDICYEKLPVILVGDGAGVVYSSLGTSHQSTEDVAALRALPQLSILSPADGYEMSSCFQRALAAEGPVYLRIGKADLGTIHSAAPSLDGCRPLLLKNGTDVALLATGSMVHTALAVADDPEWSGASVWSVPCLKPLDEMAVVDICRSHKILIVLEEHSVFGGLGSAVAEIASTHAPTWVCRIGIQDRFSEKCGSYSYLMREHALDVPAVKQQIKHFIRRSLGTPVAALHTSRPRPHLQTLQPQAYAVKTA
jgi:transketolase